jgi:hypothetical protein
LATAVDSLGVTEEELALVFAPEEDGWIALRLHDEERPYSPSVAQRLAAPLRLGPSSLAGEVVRLKRL